MLLLVRILMGTVNGYKLMSFMLFDFCACVKVSGFFSGAGSIPDSKMSFHRGY